MIIVTIKNMMLALKQQHDLQTQIKCAIEQHRPQMQEYFHKLKQVNQKTIELKQNIRSYKRHLGEQWLHE